VSNVDGYKNIELLREYSLSEAMAGLGLVGGVIQALMNEMHAGDERLERLSLQEKLDEQRDNQIAALLEQNQQLMAMLLQQQSQQAPAPAPQAAPGIDLGALLAELARRATPEQREQVQRLLANNPQTRLALPERAPAARKRGR
jgi:hypothetical protein